MMSGVIVVCPCSLVILRVPPGSPSHLKPFDAGKSLVCLVDLELRGIFFFAWCADIRRLLVTLRVNMDICFGRFSLGFSMWSILSFISFLSGYIDDMIDLRFGVRSHVHDSQ
jgi:hypothetical protein